MTDKITGKCTQMCPEDEITMREKERLLHTLEMEPGTEKSLKPKADRTRMVKAYSRCAAGQSMQTPKSLRTPEAILITVNYLLFDVISTKTLPWNVVYDFIVDRLLAVRQEMVIQRLSTAHCISILQPIIRFHAYAAYRLCEEPIFKFDAVLNNKNLQECLKKLLRLYDECDQFHIKSINISKTAELVNQYEELFSKSRTCTEAMYVLFNLGNVTAIERALLIPKRYRCQLVETTLKISLCFVKGNWVRVCRLIRELPTILSGIGALHLPTVRKLAFHTMSVAYSSKSLTVPAVEIMTLLLYSREQDLALDCKHYNISYDYAAKAIHFDKNRFDKSPETVSMV